MKRLHLKTSQALGLALLALFVSFIADHHFFAAAEQRATADITQKALGMVVRAQGIQAVNTAAFTTSKTLPSSHTGAQLPANNQLEYTAGHPLACFAPGTNATYVAAVNAVAAPDESLAFRLAGRWTATATDGGNLTQGSPTTITWSIVPDGTLITASFPTFGERDSPSDLKAFLDAHYGNQATWLPLIRQIFDRWSALSGITYVYESHDDGAPFRISPGQKGVRGDVRISGHFITGPSGILAYNSYPDVGDMVLDTADGALFTQDNSLGLRNVLAHEHGHGLGLSHVCPVNESKLMEPYISFRLDGPQLDEILAVQRSYGDAREKTPSKNNDSVANASDLATVGATATVTNVSIDGTSDIDVYRFYASSTGNTATITLRPTGATYLESEQTGACSSGTAFDSKTVNDLSMELLDGNGSTVLARVNNNPPGQDEVLSNIALPSGSGPYYVRVRGGAVDNVQMYELQVQTQFNSPPTNVSLTPTNVVSSDGDAVTFSATYSDVNGIGNIVFAQIETDTPGAGLHCLYTPGDNKLWLADSTNSRWTGGITPGSTGSIISNSYGSLNCAKTVVSTNSNTLRVDWVLTRNANFMGTKNMTLRVVDRSELVDGPEKFGIWTVGPRLAIDDLSINEGNSGTSIAHFTIRLSKPSTQTVTVMAKAADGTAKGSAGDFSPQNDLITFMPGETTKGVGIPIFGDTTIEADETFFINLSSATNAKIVDPQAVGTILNDDVSN
jgi:hypothetical protein